MIQVYPDTIILKQERRFYYGKMIVLTFTFIAVAFDLNSEKIPNFWILSGWTAGFLFGFSQRGFGGIFSYLSGIFVPLLLLSFLFFFRVMGAGDIKLLSVIGGFMGPFSILWCIFYSFLSAGLLSFALLCACGNLKDRFQYFFTYLQNTILTKQRLPYRIPGKNRAEHLHFSVAVLLGVLLWTGGIY